MKPFVWILVVAALAVSASPAAGQDVSIAPASEHQWSKPEGGLRARIVLKRTEVLNGTPIVSTFLVLQNVSDVMNPLKVVWSHEKIKVRMVDAAGQEVRHPAGVSYDGPMLGPMELLLPFHGELSFDISCRGAGIAGDKGALIDLGAENTFIIERGEAERFLKATLEIERSSSTLDSIARPWSGRLDLPPVKIPLTPDPLDAADLEARIRELGGRMLSNNSQESEDAVRALSLIDDLRVIPWYRKAMETDSYSLKFAAIDRLARVNSDDALAGLRFAAATRGGDIGNRSSIELGEQLANNIRTSAAQALARSPHPDAKKALLSMWQDPYHGVRISVLHELGKMDTPDSQELLRKLAGDRDPTVAQEAQRYLQLRTERKGD